MTIADLLAQDLVGKRIILHDFSLTEGLVAECFEIDIRKELLVTKVDLSEDKIVLTLDNNGEVFDFTLQSIDHLFIKIANNGHHQN